ncbi:MAG: hypothetical protein WAL90_16275 [Desulfobacterales bacterium]
MSESDPGGLTHGQQQRFWSTIESAGIDPEMVRKYGKQSRRVSVASLAQLRDLVGPPEAAMRARSAVNSGRFSSDDTVNRAIAYLYGGTSMTTTEIAGIEQLYFPVEVMVVAEADKVIPANETWVIARDEGPRVLHFGTLTMEPGSRIEIYSTLLTMTCQRLVRNS